MKQLSFRHLLSFAIVCVSICATAESAVEAQGVGGPPELISPREGEVVDNGCQNRQNGILTAFEWREVPGAVRYHLYVKYPGAQNPVIDDARILTTGYCRWEQGSYVAESNRIGWTWKVRARVNRQWTDWSAERHFDIEAVDTDCAQPRGTQVDGQPRPSVPLQVAPPSDSVFDHFPRTTTLEWTDVARAASYVVEIDCFSCCRKNAWCTDIGGLSEVVRGITDTRYSFKFVGAQPGRWRVWAVDTDGRDGPKTEWRRFRYTR